MNQATQIRVPTLVRVKQDALSRLGIYLSRANHRRVAVIVSQGMLKSITEVAKQSLDAQKIQMISWHEVANNSFEEAVSHFTQLTPKLDAVVGLGGGKALDFAKYVGFLANLPYYSVPTSLSNDGFCSPQASLTVDGKRRALAANVPFGVIIDIDVCLNAPRQLTISGVGDLVSKLTAVYDWKLAFHAQAEQVDDFAALLSESSFHAFKSHAAIDQEGIRLLATSLLTSGIAMEMCGSSRPASGSEHLISHALDAISKRPRLHGLQVGVAAYLVSLLQQHSTSSIAEVFSAVDFWGQITAEPFLRSEWMDAVLLAPQIKSNFYTILSERNTLSEVEYHLANDVFLKHCFV